MSAHTLSALVASIALAAAPAFADITTTGSVVPTNPQSWTNGTTANIGSSADGSITINGGSTITTNDVVIANGKGRNSFVTIDGATSSWTTTYFNIGNNFGNAALNMSNGATLSASREVRVTSTGALNFGPGGGTLSTFALLASPTRITGTGTINAHSLTVDADITFDAWRGPIQTFYWNSPTQNITINLDTTIDDPLVTLGAGYTGSGSISISDGRSISVGHVYLANSPGSSGALTVQGATSSLNTFSLDVGLDGAGTMSIAGGAKVTVVTTYLGHNYAYSVASGAATFGPGGGTLDTRTLFASPSQFSGTGTILAKGLVTDGQLTFDSSHGLSQILNWTGPDKNIDVHLELTDYASNFVGALGAGYLGTGDLLIKDGRQVGCISGYVGYQKGSVGTATVTGAGSAWNALGINVGYHGNGSLQILNGGQVNTSYSSSIGSNSGGVGTVTVDGTNSTWTSTSDLTVGSFARGSLIITHGGKVSDVNATLDSGNPATCTSIDGAGSSWTNSGRLIVGYYSSPRLTVTNGGTLTDAGAYIGYYQSYSGGGSVLIDGVGSTWTNSGILSVANGAGTHATLTISHGATVSSGIAYLAYAASSFPSSPTTATVTVDGDGSTWTNAGNLYIGYAATGAIATLNITHGGQVTARATSINSRSSLNMSVGDSSKLDLGGYTFTNNGTIRLIAALGAAPDIYRPITASAWAGSGTVQAFGGTWDSSAHAFTITAAALGAPGDLLNIDRLGTQRITITAAANRTLTANFVASAGSAPLAFTAALLTGAESSDLRNLVGSGPAILSAWNFTTDYAAGDPVYLTMDVGPNADVDQLAVYHYDGSTWTAYTPTDLTYDGQHASFTVTGFSGYAVTQLPEPASLSLLALGAAALLTRRRRVRVHH